MREAVTLPARAEVLILGAGPVGLEAALACRAAGHDAWVVEAGSVGESVRRWGHVRLFSPWRLNASERALRTLRAAGQPALDLAHYPTGDELVERLLLPLALAPPLAGRVVTGVRALAVGREGLLKGERIAQPDRGTPPFRVLWRNPGLGLEGVTRARVLIDATGVFAHPNPTGADGIPAPGETDARARITRVLPVISGAERARWASRRVLLIGGGYSAATALGELLALDGPDAPRITWALRSSQGAPLPEIADDPLPGRAALSARTATALHDPPPTLRVLRGASVVGFALPGGPRGPVRVSLRGVPLRSAPLLRPPPGDGASTLAGTVASERATPECEQTTDDEFDDVLSLTGYRPDTSLLAELQVHLCYATDGLMKLSAQLLAAGGGGGDCLAQAPSSPDGLRSPEPGLYVLGTKAYGRNSTFLLRTGHQQVEALLTLLGAQRSAP